MYSELSLGDFIAALSGDAPTPGGGSAAAVSGAMGAALLSMVLNISVKGKEIAEVENMKKTAEKCGRISQEFLVLADEDSQAFNKVMQAYKLPKSNNEDKEKRSSMIQLSLKSAALIPLSVMRKVNEVSNFFEYVYSTSLDSIISDFLSALELLEAAMKCALYNVEINEKLIKDKEFVMEAAAESNKIYKSFIDMREKYTALSKERLR